jgi:dethiobiotin synthetase
MSKAFFVSGIDTGIGKTYATGYLAKTWNEQGIKTITQKFIQTGNINSSEDIEKHREIMECGTLKEDISKLTMPEIFTYPASPHLASAIDGRDINFDKIQHATQALSNDYECVLLEGAGGLMVPLTKDYLTIDYLVDQAYPVILVSSGRLGSINHTLLSLEALKAKGIELYALAYNLADESKDAVISRDTADYLKNYLFKNFPNAKWIDIPKFEN